MSGVAQDSDYWFGENRNQPRNAEQHPDLDITERQVASDYRQCPTGDAVDELIQEGDGKEREECLGPGINSAQCGSISDRRRIYSTAFTSKCAMKNMGKITEM